MRNSIKKITETRKVAEQSVERQSSNATIIWLSSNSSSSSSSNSSSSSSSSIEYLWGPSLDMDPQKGSGLLEQKCFQFTLEL